MGEKTIFIIKPSAKPIIFSLENLVLIVFLGLVTTFGMYFHFGWFEIVIIVLLILVILSPVITKAIRFAFTKYIITNSHIIIETHFIKTWKRSVDISRVRSVRCKQNMIDRLLKTGDIILFKDEKKIIVRLFSLDNCKEIQKKLESISKI